MSIFKLARLLQLKWLVLVLSTSVLMGLSVFSFFKYKTAPKQCDGNYIHPNYILQSKFIFSQNYKCNHYSLYLHRENDGNLMYKHMDEDAQLNGVPVLFIPGHAGDYTQIQSFASAAHRVIQWKRSEGRSVAGFDIFTMDTKKEFGAFSDAALFLQAQFASEAIVHILGKYKHLEHGPKSVHIIGHSMGGFVARLIPLLEDLYPNSLLDSAVFAPAGTIQSIITLSSPHNRPPVPLSMHIDALYTHVNRIWSNSINTISIQNTTVVSIASGRKDTVLNSELTHIKGIVDPSRGFGVYATAMPNVWATFDHEGALWCNQLIEKIADAMFDLHDWNDSYSLLDVDRRMSILKTAFLNPPKLHNAILTPMKQKRLEISSTTFTNNSILSIPDLADDAVKTHTFSISANSAKKRMFRLVTSSCSLNINNDSLLDQTASTPIDILAASLQSVTDELPVYYNLRQSLARQIPQSTTEPFKLMFRRLSDLREDGRPCWTMIEVNTNEVFGPQNNVNILLKKHSDSTGFVEANFDDFDEPHSVAISTFDLIFGTTVTLDTSAVVSHFVFPRIKDNHLKYLVKITPQCDEHPTFPPFVEYGAPPSNDFKFVSNISDTILSWYHSPSDLDFKSGLKMALASPLSCKTSVIRIKIHWIASLGLLIGDFITFLPAMIVASMLLYSSPYFYSLNDQKRILSLQSSMDRLFMPTYLFLFALDLIYPYITITLNPSTIFLGHRDLANPFGLHFWFSVSTSIIYVTHLLLEFFTWGLGQVAGSLLSVMFSLRLGIAGWVPVGIAVIFFPWHTVHLLCFTYLFLHASYQSKYRRFQDDVAASQTVLMLSAMLIPFSVLSLSAVGVFTSPHATIRHGGWIEWIALSSMSRVVGSCLQLVLAFGHSFRLWPFWTTRINEPNSRKTMLIIYLLASVCIAYGYWSPFVASDVVFTALMLFVTLSNILKFSRKKGTKVADSFKMHKSPTISD
ncbi:hypothetical protein BDEG_23781 [Batrachochytrium dendrobatidis JEL423]|uniref:GPI inositol-deacylase n=2 Tax=Batrachochytrium dendrobatidis (strain JEL423) TaxID=403673 RepID=A0A177WIQ1_BATDL|nr:hypothetical protein BDEG_23781 [Batrachochytrium dendrobatidis JEL423]